jgi:ABC-type Mn2+/Zn2+ transport system permease subunit
MGALTIIPAAIARNMSSGMKKYMLLSAAFGVLISTVGVCIAAFFAIRPGPAIVLLGVVIFVISLTAARRQR